jgi:class 3 adenylate cyclase/dihydrofolate reductase
MGRLVVTEFMTLDGVMEAPGAEEHRAGRNAWALRLADEDVQRYNLEQIEAAEALLFGRTTYLIWAAFWPALADDPVIGRRVNDLPKYVVSRSLRRTDWNNSTIVRGDLATEVEAIKERTDGEVVVYGSADLVDQLLRLGLVDELRLMLHPILLGSGKRLFRDESDMRYFRLVRTRPFPAGVVLLIYEPTDAPPSSRYEEEFAWSRDQVESFHAAQDTDRVLATVMFTDIVDSTARAAELGDRGWRQVLDRHDEVAKLEVERWHGKFVKSTGDGILATFDAPTRALRCAFGLRSALAAQRLEIRVAMHCGEVELRGDDVGGIGIHIASRALAEAGAGQVVVTRTVRELATGTDLTFESLGAVGLRGVPGQWELFAASAE